MFSGLFGRDAQIKFGTSGWRPELKDFTDRNVARVAEGMAKYLKENNQTGTVIVGFDARPTSERAAEVVCGRLAANGFDAYISDLPIPTPAVTKSVIGRNAAGGVVVTASHNPMNYNGIKLIMGGGAPLPDDTAAKIESLLPGSAKVQKYARKPLNLKEDYITDLEKNLNLSKAVGMHIVVDPMFGAAAGYLVELLRRHGANVDEIRNVRGMGGDTTPNPLKENLSDLIAEVTQRHADIGLAHDGDGDRIVAVDSLGNYYPSNQLGLIAADYMYRIKNAHGPIVRSIATPTCFDRLAARHRVNLIETKVGFKYLGAELAKGASIAIEESGGIGFGWWIPDKDGVAAGAYLIEAISQQGKSIQELWESVSKEYSYPEFMAYNVRLEEKVETTMEFLRNNSARIVFDGRNIVDRNTSDGVKLVLEDGSWVLIRESKTEPKLRIYIQANNDTEIRELSGAVNKLLGELLPY